MDINLEAKAGLSGHAFFEIIDQATGEVEYRSDQHNMILDSGLENFGTASAQSGTSGSAALTRWGAWRSFFCVGTGSTAPAVGQTTLVNQVQIGADTGGFSSEQSEVYSHDGAGNCYKAVITQVRVLNFTSSYNLTEWGLAPAASGSISIRELFRDGSNNPVSIAVSNGKQLKITHVLTMTIPNTLGAVSFDLTGLGTQNGTGGFWASSGNSGIQNLFVEMLDRNQTPRLNWNFTSIALPTANQGTPWFTTAQNGVSGTADAYVGGSKKFTRRWPLSTAQANGNLNELIMATHFSAVSSGNGVSSGFAFKWTSALTKTSTNTVTFVLDVNWTRS